MVQATNRHIEGHAVFPILQLSRIGKANPGDVRRELDRKGRKELPGVMTVFLILIGVVLTPMYTIKIFAKLYT